ncbi:hypothetical protein GBAR_LOCUS19697 [Geodia barretti]|uniref:Uncharacterized protein n=1 Tax=Geodia barretti TaxID=519541 RepID=A0AA35X205_GEOBA|nr:hypothetical protein GBAR_LOCUS19697 [Geodia barretti]
MKPGRRLSSSSCTQKFERQPYTHTSVFCYIGPGECAGRFLRNPPMHGAETLSP